MKSGKIMPITETCAEHRGYSNDKTHSKAIGIRYLEKHGWSESNIQVVQFTVGILLIAFLGTIFIVIAL